jgi:hypothetical protein
LHERNIEINSEREDDGFAQICLVDFPFVRVG